MASSTAGSAKSPLQMDSGKGYDPVPDVEDGMGMQAKLPGSLEAEMRLGFVRKVYSLLACQLLFTCLVCMVAVFDVPINHFMVSNTVLFYFALFGSIGVMFALMLKKNEHPTNMYLLGLFTFLESYTLAIICAMYANDGQGQIVVEALSLTASCFMVLSCYAWWATKRGMDFSWMGAGLGSMLWILIFWGIISMFTGVGGGLYALFGALLFCAYIVYDTHMIMTRVGYDDYILGTIMLYLDILNLFLFILQLLSDRRN